MLIVAASSDMQEEAGGPDLTGVETEPGDVTLFADKWGAGDGIAYGVTGMDMGEDGRKETGVDAAGVEERRGVI